MKTVVLNETVVKGRRLGRHVWHDPASKSHPAPRHTTTLRSVTWHRMVAPFDQGDLGSCTGNAMVGALMTEPLWKPGWALTEKDAVDFYSKATHIDRIQGIYPPDDTGSSGLAVAKVAKIGGYIPKYYHCFGIYHVLEALQRGPVIAGVPWFSSFDEPVGDTIHLVRGATMRGGHEFEILGIDVENQRLRMCNSWGTSWCDGGYAWISFADFHTLLLSGGDVVAFA